MANAGSRKRFAIDALTALRIVRDDLDIASRHPLVGPAVLRSHVLSMLYREVREGSLDERTARAQLEGIARLKVRLLGDRVSRATAWKLARNSTGMTPHRPSTSPLPSFRPMRSWPATSASLRQRLASSRSPPTTTSANSSLRLAGQRSPAIARTRARVTFAEARLRISMMGLGEAPSFGTTTPIAA